MKWFKAIFFILAFISIFSTKADAPKDGFCGLINTAFLPDEQLSYTVYYSVVGIYINAGTATFTNTLERFNNRATYHIVAEGKTNSSYDWIYKVRDRYESYIDTATLLPQKFIRNVDEGGYKKYENITFNHAANTAVTTNGVFKIPVCIQDVISAVYYARNIDFNRYRPGDRILFNMFLDNEVYNMYIRYLGKEEIKTKYGRFNAIKFKPLLLKGSIFEGGEKMTVWITDDKNHIPVRIESPIVVGSIKVDMMSYHNLRYPLDALKRVKGS